MYRFALVHAQNLHRGRDAPGSIPARPRGHYAKVFAGKEAVFKCFGISADDLGSWRDVEVVDSEERQPVVNLSGSLAAIASARGVSRVLLSLSYDTDYAIAVAAIVGEAQHED